MRFKASLLALISTALLASSASHLSAQVAPAARLGTAPISIGVGMSGYNLDYGPGRYMEGPVAWASVRLFHGLGVDGSARAIFINTPSSLTRMQQNTFLGGVFYQGPRYHFVRPFVRAGAGLGTIEFPSRNPYYTRDSYTVFAPSGGLDFRVTDRVAIRAQYEYQFWQDFRGPHFLTPQGTTLGVSYSLGHPRHHYR